MTCGRTASSRSVPAPLISRCRSAGGFKTGSLSSGVASLDGDERISNRARWIPVHAFASPALSGKTFGTPALFVQHFCRSSLWDAIGPLNPREGPPEGAGSGQLRAGSERSEGSRPRNELFLRPARKRLYHLRVSTISTRSQRNWQTGERLRLRMRAAQWSAGKRLLLDLQRGAPGAPYQGPRAEDRPQAADRPPHASWHPAAGVDPVQRHPEAPGHRHPQRLPGGDHGGHGRYICVYADQSESAAAGRRGSARLRTRVRIGLEAGSKPELLAVAAQALQRHADHLQRLQRRRVHRDGHARPENRAHGHSCRREVRSWG